MYVGDPCRDGVVDFSCGVVHSHGECTTVGSVDEGAGPQPDQRGTGTDA